MCTSESFGRHKIRNKGNTRPPKGVKFGKMYLESIEELCILIV